MRRIDFSILSVPRLLLDYTSGRRAIKKGAFIGSLTSSDVVWPIGPELRDAFLLGARVFSYITVHRLTFSKVVHMVPGSKDPGLYTWVRVDTPLESTKVTSFSLSSYYD